MSIEFDSLTPCKMAYKNPLDDRARAARRKHYDLNKEQYYERNKIARDEKRKYIYDLKESTPCKDCGKIYPHYVMDFDHVRDTKISNVSKLTTKSWKGLLSEIDKCEIVCANCHRARTHTRSQYN